MHRFFLWISRAMALVGGFVLTLLVLLVCISIVGRTLNGVFHSDFLTGLLPGFSSWMLALGIGPINGDYELVEAGIAFSIFAFLPLTQITAGHASVDIFTAWMPRRANRVLSVLIDALFAVVLVYIALQLKEGMDSKMRSGTTTFLLQFPIWWAYAASLVGATLAAVVGVYVALARAFELVSGRTVIAEDMGAEH